MLRYGVFVLSRSRREEAEERLTALATTPEQVAALFEHIRAGEPDEALARKYMAALLTDDARLREALEGIATYTALREPSGVPHAVNMPLGTPSCRCVACERWRSANAAPDRASHEDRCRRAVYLKRADRWSDAALCAEFGVTVDELAGMLRDGEARAGLPEWVGTSERGKALKKSQATDAEAEKRASEFRSADRRKRMRLLRGEE